MFLARSETQSKSNMKMIMMLLALSVVSESTNTKKGEHIDSCKLLLLQKPVARLSFFFLKGFSVSNLASEA